MGEVELFKFREVVDEVEDSAKQISVEEARELDPDSEVGDDLGEKIETKDFGRISAQMAKQVIIQRVRDAEKENVYNEYKDRKNEIVNGIVRRFEKGNMIVDLGRAEAIDLPDEETRRRSEATTPEWPIMHAVMYGVSRDQMMAKHKSNHIQVAYATDSVRADEALLAKASMAEALGMTVNLCGTRKKGKAW